MSASYKAVLRPAQASGLRPIHIRFTAESKHAYWATGIAISASYWNEAGKLERANWIRRTHPEVDVFNAVLQAKMREAQEVVLKNPKLTAAALRDLTAGRNQPAPAEEAPRPDFLAYFAQDTARRGKSGHPRTAEKFASILHKIREYLAGPPAAGQDPAARSAQLLGQCLPFDELTPRWVRDYEAHLSTLGNKASTINKELSFINTVLRLAAEDGKIEPGQNPFLRLRLKRPAAAPKVKLTDEQVRAMEALDLPAGQVVALARESWLLQYFLLGSRIGDVVTLRWRNVHADEVRFFEHKTGKLKQAPRHERLDAVLSRLRHHHGLRYEGREPGPDDFVLPALRADHWYAEWPAHLTWQELQNSPRYREAWMVLLRKVESTTSSINYYLKPIQAAIGVVDSVLTTHTARHSFADAGRRAGLSIADMRDVLNHHSVSMTEAYMGQLEGSEVAVRALAIYQTPPAA